MINTISKHSIGDYVSQRGVLFREIDISYEIFGRTLHTAPIVVVLHALTGNSNVADKNNGWWRDIIGKNRVIDTETHTVIAFNIPGNGYDGLLLDDFRALTAADVAQLFLKVLDSLQVRQIYALIGGSLGGGIAWELAVLSPKLVEYLIPIASDWKSSDWIIAHNHIQENILK